MPIVKLYVGQAPVPAIGPGGLSTQFTLSGVEVPASTTSTGWRPPSPSRAAHSDLHHGRREGTRRRGMYTRVSLWTLFDDAQIEFRIRQYRDQRLKAICRGDGRRLRGDFLLSRKSIRCSAASRTWWPPIRTASSRAARTGLRGWSCQAIWRADAIEPVVHADSSRQRRRPATGCSLRLYPPSCSCGAAGATSRAGSPRASPHGRFVSSGALRNRGRRAIARRTAAAASSRVESRVGSGGFAVCVDDERDFGAAEDAELQPSSPMRWISFWR